MTANLTANLTIDESIVVRPGEILVLRFGRQLTIQQAGEIRDYIAATFPGLADRVLIVNADQLAVIQPEATS